MNQPISNNMGQAPEQDQPARATWVEHDEHTHVMQVGRRGCLVRTIDSDNMAVAWLPGVSLKDFDPPPPPDPATMDPQPLVAEAQR